MSCLQSVLFELILNFSVGDSCRLLIYVLTIPYFCCPDKANKSQRRTAKGQMIKCFIPYLFTLPQVTFFKHMAKTAADAQRAHMFSACERNITSQILIHSRCGESVETCYTLCKVGICLIKAATDTVKFCFALFSACARKGREYSISKEKQL